MLTPYGNPSGRPAKRRSTTFDDVFVEREPDRSLVQNRLNVAALALAALLFSGSFSLALSGQEDLQATGAECGPLDDPHFTFLHVELALALGVVLTLLSIASLLVAQQAARRGPFHVTRVWWFSLGQVTLYVALSQALSASLTEIVFGLARFSPGVGKMVAGAATLVWWLLLFIAPIHYLVRVRNVPGRTGARVISLIYGVLVVGVILAGAEVYRVRGCGSAATGPWLRAVGWQVVQPMTWANPW